MNNLPAYLHTPDREDEFEPPVTEREPACDDDTIRCLGCEMLIAGGEFCPDCEREYRAAIREQARDAARESFDAGLYGVTDAICRRAGL